MGDRLRARASGIHDKVASSTVGAAVSQIVVWAFEATSKVDVPSGIEVAFATVVVFASGYFVRESKPPTALAD
jgi:hypothetical protein